jgi:hypothetical protein
VLYTINFAVIYFWFDCPVGVKNKALENQGL